MVFEDLDENSLLSIISRAKVGLKPAQKDQQRILTKESLVKTSSVVTSLQNSFNKILAHTTNTSNINQVQAKHLQSAGKEGVMERGGAAMASPSASGGLGNLDKTGSDLSKQIEKLTDSLGKLDLTATQSSTESIADEIGGALSTTTSIGLPTKGKLGLAGKTLGIVGVGLDVVDRASSGQGAGQIAAGVGGGMAGGWAGTQAGAALGGTIGAAFGGVGAVPGALIGGAIGGLGGYLGGSWLGDAAYDAATKEDPSKAGRARNAQRQAEKNTQAVAQKVLTQDSEKRAQGGLTGTRAPSLSDKFSSFLGNTIKSISSYVSSLPATLASLGGAAMGAIGDLGSAIGEGYEAITTGGKAADMEQAIVAAGVRDPTTKAQIMAQTAHESGNFKYTTELGGPSYFKRYEGRRDLGNVQPGDGYKYRGRGFLQVTGRANYAQMSRELGVDFVSNPDLLSTPKYAALSAMVWFKKRWNRLDGKWGDTRAVTRVVNGGYNGLADRVAKYAQYSKLYASGKSVSEGAAGLVQSGREAVGGLVQAGKDMLSGAAAFIHPIAAVRITSKFGPRSAPAAGASSYHKGVDYGPRKPGTQGDAIFASASGVVSKAGPGSGYGNVIYVDHPGGYQTRYAHLRGFTVSQGARVQKGQQIGQLGNTGIGSGPHLHFEIIKGGQKIDPLRMLGSATIRPDATATEPGNEQGNKGTRGKPPAGVPATTPPRGNVGALANANAAARRQQQRAGASGATPGRGGGGGGVTLAVGGGGGKGQGSKNPSSRPWYQKYLGG